MIIKNAAEYDVMHREVTDIVKSNTEYPSYVFKRPFRFIYFMEHRVALEYELVGAFASKSGDSSVKQLYLNPSADELWLKECGHYGAITVDTKNLKRDWYSDLTFSIGPAMNDMYSWPGTALIYGNLKRWATFNDLPFDLSVTGSDIDFSDILEPLFVKYVHDVEWAIKYWKDTKSRMNEDFYSQLRKNYESKN